jgi:pimeloyl-ACP methyl ester carboxylesterase
MRKSFRLFLLLALLVSSSVIAAPAQARALPVPGPCVEGTLPSGALSLICIPTRGWNRDLVVYGHGYVAFNEPLDFYHLELPDGTYLPDLIQGLGFAFATTSYRRNGLVVLDGADDVRELVAAFPAAAGQAPVHTYMTGVSEGGLVTTLLVEQSPELFSGGLATCGPIGSFKKQIDYVGDMRVLFDYFFSGVIPPSPIDIPPEVIENWESVYEPAITAALAANPTAAQELMRTAKAATDPNDPSTVTTTAVNVLWYNAYGTNDSIDQLGGNPYGNRGRWYTGSSNDQLLNQSVQRFAADRAALNALTAYQTSGAVTIPLVTLHTTKDEVVPYWQELLYFAKVKAAGSNNVILIPVSRYGHCNFTTAEVLAAFGLLVLKVTGSRPAGIEWIYDAEQAQRDFAQVQRDPAWIQPGE